MAKALLATVGGTQQPLVKTILEHRPDLVYFLCSQASIEIVPRIKADVDDTLAAEGYRVNDRKALVDDVEDLVGCYTHAARAIRWLDEQGYRAEEVVVDYTGGTKTMSVAVALAAVAQGCRFSYVGGRARTKEGLGIVVDGTEAVRQMQSPWSLFAVDDLQRVAEFFNLYQYAAASRLCDSLLGRSELDAAPRRLAEILRLLCAGYASWDRFEHKEAVETLKRAAELLETYVSVGGHAEQAALLANVRTNVASLQALQRESHGFQRPVAGLAADLVANAGRRAEEGKFDDAVARLYRALEVLGQVSLADPPLGVKDASDVPEIAIPESLREEYTRRYRDERDGKIKLPLFATFRLLAESGHPRGARFVDEETKVRGILTGRNNSILAHGFAPVGEQAYLSFSTTLRSWLDPGGIVAFPKVSIQ